MKIRSTITKLIAITMAMAAIAVIGSSWAAGRAGAADNPDGGLQLEMSRSLRRALYGFIPGQSLRVSVGNPANTPGSTVTWTYKVTNPGNVPLYESEWIRVQPREFRFSDVSRRDLTTEGEPGTGRAQVMVTVTIIAPAGSNPADIPCSLEIIDEETGSGALIIPPTLVTVFDEG